MADDFTVRGQEPVLAGTAGRSGGCESGHEGGRGASVGRRRALPGRERYLTMELLGRERPRVAPPAGGAAPCAGKPAATKPGRDHPIHEDAQSAIKRRERWGRGCPDRSAAMTERERRAGCSPRALGTDRTAGPDGGNGAGVGAATGLAVLPSLPERGGRSLLRIAPLPNPVQKQRAAFPPAATSPGEVGVHRTGEVDDRRPSGESQTAPFPHEGPPGERDGTTGHRARSPGAECQRRGPLAERAHRGRSGLAPDSAFDRRSGADGVPASGARLAGPRRSDGVAGRSDVPAGDQRAGGRARRRWPRGAA